MYRPPLTWLAAAAHPLCITPPGSLPLPTPSAGEALRNNGSSTSTSVAGSGEGHVGRAHEGARTRNNSNTSLMFSLEAPWSEVEGGVERYLSPVLTMWMTVAAIFLRRCWSRGQGLGPKVTCLDLCCTQLAIAQGPGFRIRV